LLGADAIEANRTVGGFSWHPDLKAAKALLEAIEPEIAENSAISTLALGGRSNARIRRPDVPDIVFGRDCLLRLFAGG
jgi:hypothetical protein